MIKFLQEKSFGFIVASLVAVLAIFLAPYIPSVNGVILAFLLAVILGNIIKLPSATKAGIKFSSSTVLEIAIIFLAFSISFSNIAALGWQKFLYIVFIILVILVLTVFLSKRFFKNDSTSLLVGFGTAICGSSAIAAAAPLIAKDDKDGIGISIAVVNLLGSVGMVALPYLLMLFIQDELDLGFILGGSLQSVGNVAGAGYAISDTVGEAAITVKLARVALLSPAVILFSFLANRNSTSASAKASFNLPYYLWIFILITLVNSIVTIPENALVLLKETGEIILTISMAAIGLNVSFKTLWLSGRKAIGFGLIIFGVQIALAIALISIF